MVEITKSDLLLMLDKVSFKQVFSVCKKSKEFTQVCLNSRKDIVKLFLTKLYSNDSIKDLVELNDKYNIYKLNKIVQTFFENKEFHDILKHNTVYITKKCVIYIEHDAFLLPLPDHYYEKIINVNLNKLNNTKLKDACKNLWSDKSNNGDIIVIDKNNIQYSMIDDLISENIKKTDILSKTSKKYQELYLKRSFLNKLRIKQSPKKIYYSFFE